MQLINVTWLTLLVFISLSPEAEAEAEDKDRIPKKQNQTNLSRKGLYKYGFDVKRAEQREGVKRIQRIKDYSKRYKMVKTLVDKMFQILMAAKVKVTEMGYIPGEEFPEEQAKLDNLGHVFENVALFGDLILRCPDVTHKLYDSNQEWKVAMNWGFMFSNETGIFEGVNAKLLHLAAQELEMIPNEENFLNPYKEATLKAQEIEKLKMQEEQYKRKESKKKKKKKKGPRLGGSSGEL